MGRIVRRSTLVAFHLGVGFEGLETHNHLKQGGLILGTPRDQGTPVWGVRSCVKHPVHAPLSALALSAETRHSMKTLNQVMTRLDHEPDAVVIQACLAAALLLPLLLWW